MLGVVIVIFFSNNSLFFMYSDYNELVEMRQLSVDFRPLDRYTIFTTYFSTVGLKMCPVRWRRTEIPFCKRI